MPEIWFKVRAILLGLNHPNKKNRLTRYGFALGLIVIVFLIKFWSYSFLGSTSNFILLTFVVSISSWFGGVGPGVFTTLISAILNFFFFLLRDRAIHPELADLILSQIFIIEGLIISMMSEAKFEMELQKDKFIAFVAHELKNPLTTIKGYTSLIEQKTEKEKVAGYAKEVALESDKLVRLINDLMDLTQIEVGKFIYHKEYLDLGDLTKKIIQHQKIIFKDRVIKLNIKSHKVIFADNYRLGQVIINLLTNAFKYSSDEIEVDVKNKKSDVILAVKDFGSGINKKDQNKIFSSYYRTNNAKKGSAEGLGLGLYICSQIIKDHGGKLWVQSKEGVGSTFFVALPAT